MNLAANINSRDQLTQSDIDRLTGMSVANTTGAADTNAAEMIRLRNRVAVLETENGSLRRMIMSLAEEIGDIRDLVESGR